MITLEQQIAEVAVTLGVIFLGLAILVFVVAIVNIILEALL